MTLAKPADPNLTWSFDLPVKLKCAIADCITLYAKIESCIVETIWEIEGANLEQKKEIAKAWASENVRFIKRVIKAMPGAETDAIWPTLNKLQAERNLIGHGVWMFASDGRPLVVWHSKFLESDDWIGSEYFDWHRFDQFLERGEVLLKTFFEFKALLQQADDETKAILKAGAQRSLTA
jgi:hypothetical protein